jgi:hypothetical protein
MICIAAVISISIQGFEYGVLNNIFHIPIVLRFGDLPQFGNDGFIQSLQSYASIVYPLMAKIANPANVKWIFLSAHLITRVANFGAFAAIAWTLGLREWRELAIFLATITFAPVLYGVSPVGKDGTLITYFTHTELAQAIGLISLCLAMQKRLTTASLLWGVAFDINAFVGVWCAFPLAWLVLRSVVSPDRRPVRALAGPVTLAFVTVVPSLLWIFFILKPQHADFSYPNFLREYYPYHFFIGVASKGALVTLAMIVASAGLSFRLLPGSTRWRAVLISFILVFLIGCLIPEVTASPIVLNLHMLRVDGLIQILSVVLVVSGFVSYALADDALPEQRALALLGLAAVLLGLWHAVLLTLATVHAGTGKRRAAGMAVVACAGIALLFMVRPDSPLILGPGLLSAVLAFSIVIFVAINARSLPGCALALTLLGGIDHWLSAACALLVAAAIARDQNFGTGLCKISAASATACLIISIARGGLFSGPNALALIASALVAGIASRLSPTRQWLNSTRGPLYGLLAVTPVFALAPVPAWSKFDGMGPSRQMNEFPSNAQLESQQPISAEWIEVQNWARTNTRPDSVFMVPPSLSGFQIGSMRRVWVTEKEGAAAMWAPAFYHQWHSRIEAQLQLLTFDAIKSYACENGISFVVLDKRPPAYRQNFWPRDWQPTFPEPALRPAFENRVFEVFALAAQCRSKQGTIADPFCGPGRPSLPDSSLSLEDKPCMR